jgi:hypothetical protein
MLPRLKERLINLEQQKQFAQKALNQAIADITAIGGAIQEVMYWISMLEGADDLKTNLDKE